MTAGRNRHNRRAGFVPDALDLLPDGNHVAGENYPSVLSGKRRLLHYLGRFRLATSGQLRRYFLPGGQRKDYLKALEDHLARGRVGVARGIPLVEGRHRETCDLYYLTRRGYQSLVRGFVPALRDALKARMNIRHGHPTKKELCDATHTVTLGEYFLRLWREYRILRVIPEWEIAEHLRLPGEGIPVDTGYAPIPHNGTGIPDLVVQFCPYGMGDGPPYLDTKFGEGDFCERRVEISISMSDGDILTKPLGTHWVVRGRRQAAAVEYGLRHRLEFPVQVINDVSDETWNSYLREKNPPSPEAVDRRVRRLRDARADLVAETLRAHAGLLLTNTLGELTGLGPAALASTLDKLEGAGAVAREYLALRPGQWRAKPWQSTLLTERVADHACEKISLVMRSILLHERLGEVTVESAPSDLWHVSFRRSDSGEAEIFVIDDARQEEEEVLRRAEAIYLARQNEPTMRLTIAANTVIRHRRFERLLEELEDYLRPLARASLRRNAGHALTSRDMSDGFLVENYRFERGSTRHVADPYRLARERSERLRRARTA